MKFLVDSSVWIDLLADRQTVHTEAGRQLIAQEHEPLVGDVILAEVLQGTRDHRDLATKLGLLAVFQEIRIVDHAVAVQAARNYQALRARGITIRKTIDTLIATRCIVGDVPLLYSDRDFDPFVKYLGLKSALNDIGAA